MARRLLTTSFALFAALLILSVAGAARAHGGGEEEEPTGPSDVLALGPDTFDAHVGGSAFAFVEFYAPWWCAAEGGGAGQLSRGWGGGWGGPPVTATPGRRRKAPASLP